MRSVYIGLGEYIDRITILSIKIDKLTGHKKDIASNELVKLEFTWDGLSNEYPGMLKYSTQLKEVNTELWEVEDKIRELDVRLVEKGELYRIPRYQQQTVLLEGYSQKDLDEFVELARHVYLLNDRRYALKNHIDTAFGDGATEVKSYVK